MNLHPLRRLRGVLIAAPALHPFLLGLWFVLDVSRREVHPGLLAASTFFLILGAGTFVARLLLNRIFADGNRAGIGTTVLLIPLLCFQEVRQFLATIGPSLAEFHLVVPLFGLFVALSFIVLWKVKGDLAILHGAMNASSIIFVLWSLFPFVKGAYATSIPEQGSAIVLNRTAGVGIARDPDIYYLLLDAYTAQKSLARFWGFDNADFLAALKRRDFFVADDSRSRYITTVQSMASTLNMDTLVRGKTRSSPFETTSSSGI